MWQLERQHLYSGNSKSCFLCFEMRSPSWPRPCAAEAFCLTSISSVEIRLCQTALKPILRHILGTNPLPRLTNKWITKDSSRIEHDMRMGQQLCSGNVVKGFECTSRDQLHLCSQSESPHQGVWLFPLCFACSPRGPSSLHSPSPGFPAACGKVCERAWTWHSVPGFSW